MGVVYFLKDLQDTLCPNYIIWITMPNTHKQGKEAHQPLSFPQEATVGVSVFCKATVLKQNVSRLKCSVPGTLTHS